MFDHLKKIVSSSQEVENKEAERWKQKALIREKVANEFNEMVLMTLEEFRQLAFPGSDHPSGRIEYLEKEVVYCWGLYHSGYSASRGGGTYYSSDATVTLKFNRLDKPSHFEIIVDRIHKRNCALDQKKLVNGLTKLFLKKVNWDSR